MATQRHSTLQTTQLHAAIILNGAVTFVQNLIKKKYIYIYKFHCSFFNTEHAEVGTGSRRMLWCHQLVILEHPPRLRHTLMNVASV